MKLLNGPGEVVSRLLPLRRFADLGPAVYIDASRYAARRAQDGASDSRLLYEVFYAYFLPQFEGMDDDRATALYRTVEPLFDEFERTEAQRTIGEVLGIELSI
jgi:hypothetical protein